MNVLVLGGTRYFGKGLVRKLCQRGDNVTIATRGHLKPEEGCHFVYYDREHDICPEALKMYWDVVYDQSCYAFNQLFSMQEVIAHCGVYIFTSSQAVYPFRNNIQEHETCQSSPYGKEKLAAEVFIQCLNENAIFPRFPVVVGVNDNHQRLQSLMKEVSTGKVILPQANPMMSLATEAMASSALFKLSHSACRGAVNVAYQDPIDATKLTKLIATELNLVPEIEYVAQFQTHPFSLIKNQDKTLSVTKAAQFSLCEGNIISEMTQLVKAIHLENT
jgi:nucleoside-diphosphate-sugar epimerase